MKKTKPGIHKGEGQGAGREAFLRDTFARTARVARRLVARIERELTRLEAEAGSEAATKELLALVKAAQSMEDLARTMEKAVDEREGEPEDILEFRRRLERMLEALAGSQAQ